MIRCIKYCWFYLCMRATSLLPDFTPLLRFRGWLVRPCFKRCGRNFQIASGAMIVYTSRVTIGNDVSIACGSWIHGMGNVTLEDEVMLGPYCVLVSGTHTRKDGSYRFGSVACAPIHVGKGAWICSHAVITAGVEVGPGAVCGAGAVLTRNVPPNKIVAGIPARVVKSVENGTSNADQPGEGVLRPGVPV
jgi:maltose O-acetyltransferase